MIKRPFSLVIEFVGFALSFSVRDIEMSTSLTKTMLHLPVNHELDLISVWVIQGSIQ